MTTTVFERVRAIIVRELCVDLDSVTIDAHLRGDRLKADSLDLVNLVMALAIEFDIEMNDNEVRKISTVGEVVNYLEYWQLNSIAIPFR